MAKITIVIEDQPGDRVRCVCTPSAETMLKKVASGHQLTSGEGYALFVLNKLRQESKSRDSSIIVPVPRIGRQ